MGRTSAIKQIRNGSAFSVTVTLSMIFRLPRSRMVDFTFSALNGPDVVLGQNLLDSLQSFLDHNLIV